ncbi:MAG: long-chain fatty acid--CoA ligase [Chloroflexi bacterium]|jgi:long-chain acyl-CoA synthetase|uniref:Long-chain fatty acid--CoA ligase n=1 Tax=Candidatus Thermofonsia Clade 3 bacterium TaxID=2364212 RepID=A0A2M8QBC9_9CHLR|nr:long-chain fatty acid--CoA ligase [Candidatus Roseilinea sp. NK_OTU-006]PJF47106.1 MAG: long-chain fatty acid--CoA ligase [Candidatus Thermofonsia Clade 3 bacterium]RMG64957.1 MAG: long-chain fatty acid--CoA ligase [Chloroflexota bacterium]
MPDHQPSPKPWLNRYDKGVPATLNYPKATLYDLLAETVRKYPDRLATKFVLRYILGDRVMVGGTLTYGRLGTLVERFAAALHALGVKRGDRVALMLPNSPHFIIAFFAAARLGVIVVNTNPTYTARELKQQLVDSGAETIVLLNLFYPRLKEIRAETAVEHVIVAHIDDTLPFPFKQLVRLRQRKAHDWVDVSGEPGIRLFGDMLATADPAPAPAAQPDDVALFQYTGGTTGVPKAAMLAHRNLVCNTMQVRAWLTSGVEGGEKVMAAIPFFHVYGMTVCMLYGVAMAAELVIVPNPRPIENVMRIISKERCTIYPGVPAMYIGIVNSPNVGRYDLKSVKACISGSAPLPVEIQKRFNALTGGRLVEGYGLTEASPVTHCNPEFNENRAGSIGLPFPDTEAKLVDLATGADLPMDGNLETIGELCVRGPQVMKGYWNRPDETARAIDADGWLHTGDIARMDADGYFYIVDRKKDMINVGGLKVLPRDVEEVLFTHPAVLEAAVVGVPHPTRGDDTLTAFVVLKPGASATADELKEFCKQSLAPYKIPRVIEFRTELPKTQVGKVLRRVLVAEAQEQQKVAGG